MFTPLKKWLSSSEQSVLFFDHPEDEKIHKALASVLFHIVNSENHHESSREYRYFADILEQEFDLNPDQISRLHKRAETSSFDLTKDLTTINEYLKDNPQIRMRFMDKLIHFIDVDGIGDGQLLTFNQALNIIFPNVEVT